MNKDKDYYIVEGDEGSIIYHSLSGKIAVIQESSSLSQINDEILYSRFPDMLKYRIREDNFNLNQA